MKEKIIKKLENKISLSEKEIEFLNEQVKVYDFSNSLGHLTLFGKNERVGFFREQLLEEIAVKDYYNDWDEK